jgi:hypothetical protein
MYASAGIAANCNNTCTCSDARMRGPIVLIPHQTETRQENEKTNMEISSFFEQLTSVFYFHLKILLRSN